MSWRYFSTAMPSQSRLLQVLRAPIVSEKSAMGGRHNELTFRVAPDATKREIKLAVEQLFKVTVVSVNTLNTKGKEKRFRGRKGMRTGYRKAMVRLQAGDSIDLYQGV